LFFVFAKIGKFLTVAVLVTTLGAHWTVLQTAAWTAMLANNLQSGSLQTAVEKTFDGKHLCPVCQAIAAGKQSEKKNEFSFQSQKLEFPPAAENFILIAPARFDFLPRENFSAKNFTSKPPLPPPRGFFV
jgi:hypothetical protein